MKKRKDKPVFNDGWCFAIVNGRVAEIYFKKKYGIWAHAYVKRSEFSKSEQKMIDADIKKCQFSYRKGYYFDKKLGIKYKVPDRKKLFPRFEKLKKLELS